MQKIELGVEYVTLEGAKITVQSFHTFSETDNQAMCSDGWWRYSDGEYAGRFISEEKRKTFRHHIDMSRVKVIEPERVSVQLELFE